MVKIMNFNLSNKPSLHHAQAWLRETLLRMNEMWKDQFGEGGEE